ncbi:MAG: hypothetical protein KF893_02325 [Caldilineaceae bacterium]|nr:hypothetical protein [Caldilineaceae bacterium]
MPELPPSMATPQISIRSASLGRFWPDDLKQDRYFAATEREACCYWREVGAFSIQSGKEIGCDVAADVDPQLFRLPLLEPVMALLLHQRGHLILHASAVARNHQVFVFLGEAGLGKSTLAAALCARGFSFVADDIVAIRFDTEHGPLVLPALPRLKLEAESVAALGEDIADLPQLHPYVTKRALPVFSNLSNEPLPLRRLYRLAYAQQMEIAPLPTHAAMLHLIEHSYIGRLSGQLLYPQQQIHFRQCVEIANRIPMADLKRSWALELLPALIQMVDEDSRDL